MSLSQAETVRRAVALIGPDKGRHAECENAVRVALLMARGSAEDIQRHSRRRGKTGKHAVDRLHKGLQVVQKVIQGQNLPPELRQIISSLISPDDLARAIKLVNKERIKTGERYPYKATQKNMAAVLAYDILRQFNKKISATKGSAFCKLTALLYGEPGANMQYTCRTFLEDKKFNEVKK
jgi:hypothetical protein